ncbi:PAS/PAC sensor hybrid histidine kinase [Hyphomicrobium sp. GJ21]|uniref:PAS domain-containing hybrid sensor histidine kinase/response regulator n=1 Tax=Hyphomicrobium sp. GJ21 TaxID=113574 RepID=UPI000622BE28|nr:PAS domain-containing hybrid sensor histidine kinase/response regulator [Hyphomicrobium sp. GJ21]CEJ83654.1 PAS/PAC sensor hybrid histidine kinase [Hyphomicrobium sp. GJ21]
MFQKLLHTRFANWRPLSRAIAFAHGALASRRVALAFAVTGIVAAILGIAREWVALDEGMPLIIGGVILLSLSSMCGFARAAEMDRGAIGRADDLSGKEADVLEDAQDAHWEFADRASQYRELLDVQRDFVVRRSADGRLVFANRAFCEAFGVRSEALLGSKFEPPVLAEDDYSEAVAYDCRGAQLVHTQKGKRWIAWDFQEIKGEEGRVEFQGVGRDITVERGIERELKEARSQAEMASRAKSRFLATMSHEIRTPMNGILGMISLMRDTQLDAEQRTCARIVEDSTRALLNLVDDILDFSKIEAGKLELGSKPFSLKACVAQAMQLLAPSAAAKRLSFTSTLTNDVPEWVVGDEMRVRQIVLNLLSNAIKFTETGGIGVCVSLAPETGKSGGDCEIAIKVTDTGVGLPSEFISQLFQEFEQSSVTMARHPGGTGLGLAISKRLAQAMGGDILAESCADRGASFTAVLRFEVAEQPEFQSPVALVPRLPVGAESRSVATDVAPMLNVGGSFNVLIAEDNPINALLARKIVARAGGTSTIVADGRLAISAMRETLLNRQPAFDLVLMDVLMPVVDGLTAARTIKDFFHERRHSGPVCPPIVALTANAFAEDRERCFAAGMDDYLAKPFEACQLHDVLLRWMPQRAENASPAA